MPKNPEAFKNKLDKVVEAWDDKAATTSFGGMTLTQFKFNVQPSYDARNKIADGEQMVEDGTNEREDADAISNPNLLLVVNGVKGDPAFGENSDLYEEMGYVRKSERKTGLTRKKKTPPPAT
ncbi:MAG TPA: hypothetical protein VGG02_14730 [Chthoniobacterales bacterium]|jgi:hypothetical protein